MQLKFIGTPDEVLKEIKIAIDCFKCHGIQSLKAALRLDEVLKTEVSNG